MMIRMCFEACMCASKRVSTKFFFAVDAFTGVAEARRVQPDLILLDLGLPAGGGFLVMERLKIIPSVAVILIVVVSARDGLVNQKRAFEAGAKAFLQKPVDDAELLAVIRKALGEPAQPRKATLEDQNARLGTSR
jgi:DNA-binding response OmpR family regulator